MVGVGAATNIPSPTARKPLGHLLRAPSWLLPFPCLVCLLQGQGTGTVVRPAYIQILFFLFLARVPLGTEAKFPHL